MRRTFLPNLWVLVMILLGQAPAQADDPVAALTTEPSPGRYKVEMRSGGFNRTALVVVPKGYKAGAEPPLVLLLHGGGGSGAHALEKDGWAAKADEAGFIVVAPDGLAAAPRLPASFRTNPLVWNAGNLRGGSPRTAIDDVAYLLELLDDLKDKVPYDQNRVYCVGHSNGGGMALKAAAEKSERFAAIGMVAGLMTVEHPKPAKSLPTLYIIGTKDPLVPVEGGEVKTPWGVRQNPPIAVPLAEWATALGCETDPKVVSDKDGVRKVVYPSRSGGPTLTVLYLEGQGHDWPGGKTVLPGNLMGPNTSRLNATDEIWEFFKSISTAEKSSAPMP